MGSARGRNHPSVAERLLAEGHRFNFFQAVRVLERWAHQSASGVPRRGPPVGGDQAPRQEAVRFRALPSLGFPPEAIDEVRPAAADPDAPQPAPPEMVVSFMGLFGPQGVLPHHYTALVLDRLRRKDTTLRDFLDLFNHRTISLFYRAWEKYRFAFGYERSQPAETESDEDLFTRALYCVVGLGTAGLRRRQAFDDEALLYYAGLFAHHPRCAISLEGMLADYFALVVELRQFQGQWLHLGADDRSLLPGKGRPQGLNCRLGSSVVVGERVWDVESKFRVRLGPLGYADFRRFMPSGDSLQPLCQLVRTYVGPQFDFDIQPILLAAEVPRCQLGGDGRDPSRLGWNTWVRARPSTQNVDDAVFSQQG